MHPADQALMGGPEPREQLVLTAGTGWTVGQVPRERQEGPEGQGPREKKVTAV